MEIKLKETLEIDILEDKLVILDTSDNSFIEMNDIGRIIIEEIKEKNYLNIENIIEKIEANYEYGCDKNEIYKDIEKFINDLVEIGILIK